MSDSLPNLPDPAKTETEKRCTLVWKIEGKFTDSQVKLALYKKGYLPYGYSCKCNCACDEWQVYPVEISRQNGQITVTQKMYRRIA